MIKYDACDLSRFIEQMYGREFNVPYLIMQDQRLIEMDVNPKWHRQGDEDLVKEFEKGFDPDSWEETFQVLLNDLALKKKLKKGHYLISFDD